MKMAKLWPLAKGSVAEVHKPCIRPNCSACASGRKHAAFIFSFKEKSRRRCMYVPRELVPLLQQAIRNGRKMEELMSLAGSELIRQHRRRQNQRMPQATTKKTGSRR